METTLIDTLIESAMAAHWPILVGAALMVLVWLFRQVTGDRVPAKALPLVDAILGLVVAVATLLLAGVVWYRALALGLLTGAVAAGFWSMLGKYILPKPKASP